MSRVTLPFKVSQYIAMETCFNYHLDISYLFAFLEIFIKISTYLSEHIVEVHLNSAVADKIKSVLGNFVKKIYPSPFVIANTELKFC